METTLRFTERRKKLLEKVKGFATAAPPPELPDGWRFTWDAIDDLDSSCPCIRLVYQAHLGELCYKGEIVFLQHEFDRYSDEEFQRTVNRSFRGNSEELKVALAKDSPETTVEPIKV